MVMFFNKIPPGESWKFYTDTVTWEKNDRFVFDSDQSKGYFKSGNLAFYWFLLELKNEHKRVDLDYIMTLHSMLSHGNATIASGLAHDDVFSGISHGSFSEAGFNQLKAETEKLYTPAYYLLNSSGDARFNFWDSSFTYADF